MKKSIVAALLFSMLSSAPSFAQNVSVSDGGWVKVDGRTIGRVYVSWGWVISCSKGYVNGGGSFKADVDNQNQAIGVLLRACKR